MMYGHMNVKLNMDIVKIFNHSWNKHENHI